MNAPDGVKVVFTGVSRVTSIPRVEKMPGHAVYMVDKHHHVPVYTWHSWRMGNLFRTRVAWTGSAVVGGGLSTFFSDNLATAANISPALNTYFNAIKSYFPNTVTWNIPNGGDLIDTATGALTGSWTSGGAYTVVGTSANTYASGVGARVSWNTSTISWARRVRGSMYLVPITSNQFETDGSLSNAMVTAVNTACTTLLATAGYSGVVWLRPNPLKARVGSIAGITTGTVKDTPSWLRSRRT